MLGTLGRDACSDHMPFTNGSLAIWRSSASVASTEMPFSQRLCAR